MTIGSGLVVVVSQRATSRLVSDLSTLFMKEVAAKARTQAVSYLAAGPSSLDAIASQVAGGQLDTADDAAMESHLRALLVAVDQIAMFNVGWPDGRFLMVKRMPDGSISVKRIERRDGVAISTWDHANSEWARQPGFDNRLEPSDEAYDPRVRPWYRQAERSGALTWAEPYVFYSDRLPGIACSQPLVDEAGRLLGVVSADIGISALSVLLEALQVSGRGEAMIITSDGRVVASPRLSLEASVDEQSRGLDRPELTLPRIQGMPDSPLATAFASRLAVADREAFSFDHRGLGHVAWLESFPIGAGKRWIVAFAVPQSAWLGSLRREQRLVLFTTLLCMLLAVALAALVIRRSVRIEVGLLAQRSAQERRFIEKLEAKNREIESFAYSVSHDLKSPLNTLRGLTDLLRRKREQGDIEAVEGLFERIDAGITRMSRLVVALLELGRLGRAPDETEAIACGEIVETVLEQLEALIAERGVAIEVSTPLPSVSGDRVRLTQMFQNLIENAIKYTAGEPHPRVEIGTLDGGEAAILFVRDNGTGIEPADAERIFEPFTRLDTKQRGAGLGLATVRRIAEIHGGRVWAESEGVGRGATFFVQLPQSRDATV